MEPAFSYLMMVLVAGAIATYVWRALGVALGQRVKINSPILDWVACVAFALIAGLGSRVLLMPVGPLEATVLWARLGCAGLGVGLYFMLGRRIGPALTVGVLAFMGLSALI
ncbi:MAG: AzlD domain-containing protein [Rhodospirillales bacterium]